MTPSCLQSEEVLDHCDDVAQWERSYEEKQKQKQKQREKSGKVKNSEFDGKSLK